MPLDQLSTTSVASNSSSVATGASHSSAAAGGGGEDIAQFVAAFKEMANNLDEEGAKNMLAWSPLFLPTVEGLMRQGGNPLERAPRSKLKGSNPPEVRKPAPHPSAQRVAAEKTEHMNKLREMYMMEQQQQQQ